jgi:hypothetical protein
LMTGKIRRTRQGHSSGHQKGSHNARLLTLTPFALAERTHCH